MFSVPLADRNLLTDPYGATSAKNVAVASVASVLFLRIQTKITPIKSSIKDITYFWCSRDDAEIGPDKSV